MFLSRNVVVIGDVMLDRHIEGAVARITPDAPIPVVRIQAEETRAGGAANVASKLAGFGMQVTVVAGLGRDAHGQLLEDILLKAGVRSAFAYHSTPTTTKLVISGISSGGEKQKLLRVDYEEPFSQEADLRSLCAEVVDGADAVVISDYLKGVCSPAVCQYIITQASKKDIPVVVDPKGDNWDKYQGATFIKPNFEELSVVWGQPIPRDEDSLVSVARALLAKYHINAMLLSLDKDGLLLVSKKHHTRVAAATTKVVDVSCAGDAVVAAFTSALVSGRPVSECTVLGNLAGSLAVERKGSNPISAAELEYRFIGDPTSKIVARESIEVLLRTVRDSGKKVVFTNGCFDLLHRGHIHHLKEARDYGDVLIVGLNSDASVTRIKGAGRPVMAIEDRLSILSSLHFVDYLVVFEDDSPSALIAQIRPEVLVKGANTEAVVGEEYAQQVVKLPVLGDYSSRKIIEALALQEVERIQLKE
jgi:D-beta-D-heptose 7-phosphate kinase/D-beta-D-heptose 1-phosphate adenosyltransferase